MFWNQKPGWFGKQLASNIKALNDGDYSRIPWVFCVFAENHSPSKLAASKALSSVLVLLEFDDIIRIDEQMRQTTSMEWSIDWRKLKIDTFFTTAMSITERRAVIIFSSFNPNGYIREQAVHMMRDYDRTLAYIILRQNDWVLQVRQAATTAYDQRLQKLADGEILAALPFAEKLKWGSRDSHGKYTQRFFEKLIGAEHRADLIKGLHSQNIRTRRICINAILGASRPDIELVLIQLNREPEPFLRAMIFKKLCLICKDMDESIRVLLQDKYPLNRILALQYLCDVRANDVLDIATGLLLDRNATVRALARKIIRHYTPDFDLQAFYKDNIKQHTVAALYGLGETEQTGDAGIIERYIWDSRIAVVRAALVSLMQLDSGKYKNIVMEMLSDSRVGVVKTAQQLLLKHNVQDYDRIRETFLNTPHEYSKIKCAVILFAASKWNRLTYMLEALSCEEESVKRLALQSIQGWLFSFNKSYTQVSERTRDDIRILLSKQKEKIPASIEKELLFILK